MIDPRTLALCVALALASPLAAGAPSGPQTIEAHVVDAVRAAEADGEARGLHVAWTATGPREQQVTAEEFLAIAFGVVEHARREPFARADATVALPALGCGATSGGDPLALLCTGEDWPFCEAASAYILHRGPLGAAIVSDQALPAWPTPAPHPCGPFGQAGAREAVLASDGLPGIVVFCGLAETWLTGGPYSEQIGAAGGYKCATGFRTPVPFTQAKVTGNAALFSVRFGDVSLDYAIGVGNFLELE